MLELEIGDKLINNSEYLCKGFKSLNIINHIALKLDVFKSDFVNTV